MKGGIAFAAVGHSAFHMKPYKNITKEKLGDQEVYRLEKGDLCIWVNLQDGMNLFGMNYKGKEVVSLDQKRFDSGALYGIPVLFPTPNRTRDGIFSFEGEDYCAQMHGIVRKEAFELVEITENDSEVSLTGRLKIDKWSTLYETFPFSCTLKMTITVYESGIAYHYEVYNESEKNMPFGFALHPFFNKLEAPIFVKVAAEYVMESDEHRLPSGALIPVMNGEYDLRIEKNVNQLRLDDVYTNISHHPMAEIIYSDIHIEIDGTPDFTHMVVYTPESQSFFCIEPQTCSTDAINLHQKGLEKVSGLIVIASKNQHRGRVSFQFKTR